MSRSQSNLRSTIKQKKRGPKRLKQTIRGGIKTFTARDLQRMEFPRLRFAVPSYIAEGLTLLAGKPKIGKSWMALDFAMAVATGGKALGTLPCDQGPVLYCALEDNQRRLQRRMRKVYGDVDNWPASFHFTTSMRRLDEGLLDDLRDWIKEVEPRLVIIDTLACIRPHSKREAGYSDDYGALAPLQALAGELGVAIVLVHHLRKMHSDDPFEMISGTTGLIGAVDTALVLQRGPDGPTLYVRGREIEEVEAALEWADGTWRILGEPQAVRRSDERNAIIKVIAGAGEPLGPKQIANLVGADENNTKQLLRKMAVAGEVDKQSRGRYVLPKN